MKGLLLKFLKKIFKNGVFSPFRFALSEIYNRLKNPEVIPVIQKKLRELNLSQAERIIIFLVPSKDIVNGGIMSIFSLHQATIKNHDVHQSLTILATFPNIQYMPLFTKFNNTEIVVPFRSALRSMSQVKQLTIHVPEFYVAKFLSDLSSGEKRKIRQIHSSTVNILNQNMEIMPLAKKIDPYRSLFKEITCTTAHKQYCTLANRKLYNIPFHHFSAQNLFSVYKKLNYAGKKNLLIYSPDSTPLKSAVLKKIQATFPDLEMLEIRNITYSEYLDHCSSAKWSLSFGEGLDSYFIAPIRCGGCSFAAYNETFFTSDFQSLETVFDSYDDMLGKICETIAELDHPQAYEAMNQVLLNTINNHYSLDEYYENVKQYYLKNYTFK